MPRIPRIFVFGCLVLLAACGPSGRYYAKVDRYMAEEQYDRADSLIKKNKGEYGARNAVLYDLDRAMAQHLAGHYAESNRHLESAERRIDALYTKSVTTETGAMLSNDNTLPYEGEDFEKVMINVIGALNYVYLGQWDDALVEARKVDHKLNVMNDKYGKKNVYKEDAFARYLSGILYEGRGEFNDAFISYRKADEVYQRYRKQYGTPVPDTLPADLLRVAEATPGMGDEFRFYREKYPDVKWVPEKKLAAESELIFLSYDGLPPVKVDRFVDAPAPDVGGRVYYVRVAFPRFEPRPTDVAYAKISLAGTEGAVVSGKTEPVEDISAIAEKNLEDRIGRIRAKAIARAVSKYLAGRTARKEIGGSGGEIVGILANVYSVASEQADKRSWRTLPGMIRMARLAVKPGKYTVSAEYYSFDQRVIGRKTFEVTLKAGEKRFISNRMVGTPRPVVKKKKH
jgi:hypothetical protein